MEYPYTIKDLATKVNKTEQSLQKLLKKNSEKIASQTLHQGRFKRYSQEVMDLVIDYYRPSEAPSSPSERGMAEDSAEDSSTAAQIADLEAQIQKKDSEITELKALVSEKDTKLTELEGKLESAENERKEMIRQNASLLLLLQEEKREKMLLLPEPHKSLKQRIHDLFRPASYKSSDKKETGGTGE